MSILGGLTRERFRGYDPGMTPAKLLKWSLALLVSSPLFGAFGYVAGGFETFESVLIAMLLVCALAAAVSSAALFAWVISVGVRGGQRQE